MARVYACLLPAVSTTVWKGVKVRKATVATNAGRGVYPEYGGNVAVDWSNLPCPVLLPYWGHETVVKHERDLKALRAVLTGNFECVTVRELQQRHGGQWFAHGELYAVKDASGRSTTLPLKAVTMLLQVSWKDGYCSYLLTDKAWV